MTVVVTAQSRPGDGQGTVTEATVDSAVSESRVTSHELESESEQSPVMMPGRAGHWQLQVPGPDWADSAGPSPGESLTSPSHRDDSESDKRG